MILSLSDVHKMHLPINVLSCSSWGSEVVKTSMSSFWILHPKFSTKAQFSKPEMAVSLFLLHWRQHKDSSCSPVPLLVFFGFSPDSQAHVKHCCSPELWIPAHSCLEVPFPYTAFPSLIVDLPLSFLWLPHQIPSSCRSSGVSFSDTAAWSGSAFYFCYSSEIWLHFFPLLLWHACLLSPAWCLCFAPCSLVLHSLSASLSSLIQDFWWSSTFCVAANLC